MTLRNGLLSIPLLISLSCAGGSGGLAGNEGGSAPISEKEAIEYKKALLKCYKTGGNRIVKIEGRLRCY